MSNPGDTWWGVLLDGVVGGVIGGAATGVAVWLTLRHQKAETRELASLDLAARLASASTMLAQDIAAARPGAHGLPENAVRAWWDQYRAIQTMAVELWARLDRLFPGAAAEIDRARAGAQTSFGPASAPILERKEAIAQSLGSLAAAAMAVLTAPKQFEVKKRPFKFLRRRKSTADATQE